jgi:ketosteroid isomerase-like protein
VKAKILGFIVVGMTAMSGCAGEPDDVSARIEAHLDAFEVAWAASDAGALGALYAENAVRIASSKQTPMYGRQAVVDHYAESFAASEIQSLIELTLVESRSVGPDHVMAVGEWRLSGASEADVRTGTWLNLYDVSGPALQAVFDNASSAIPLADFASVTREMDEIYTGESSDRVDQAIDQYLGFLHDGDFDALAANSFVEAGMQVMDGGMLMGREALASGMQPMEPGTTLIAHGYGYRAVVDDLALAWGPYEVRDAEGQIIAFGQWGNLFRVVDGRLVIIVEAGGMYSG